MMVGTCGTPYSFSWDIGIGKRPLDRRRYRCEHHIQIDPNGMWFSHDSDWLWATQQGFDSWQSGAFMFVRISRAHPFSYLMYSGNSLRGIKAVNLPAKG